MNLFNSVCEVCYSWSTWYKNLWAALTDPQISQLFYRSTYDTFSINPVYIGPIWYRFVCKYTFLISYRLLWYGNQQQCLMSLTWTQIGSPKFWLGHRTGQNKKIKEINAFREHRSLWLSICYNSNITYHFSFKFSIIEISYFISQFKISNI